MSEKPAHPSAKELAAFTLGQLPAEIAERVEQHVSNCDPCCETMMGLANDDTFVGLLKEVGTSDPVIDVPNEEQIPAPLSTHPRYEVEEVIGRGGMGRVF